MSPPAQSPRRRPSPGRRERNKLRTRARLAEAALQLVGRHGFREVTVDQVARRAGVSRSTFFRYFPSKEAVLFPWREHVLARFEADLERRLPGESPAAAVRRACLAMGERYVRDRRFVLHHHALVEASPELVSYELELDRRLEAAIAAALVARSPRSRRRARLQAGAVFGVLRASLREWLASGARLDLIRLGNEAFDLLEGRNTTQGARS